MTLFITVPVLRAVIIATGNLDEGQNYTLTCDVEGDKILAVNTTQFQWVKVSMGGSLNISQSATLTFPSLNHTSDGNYICNVTITSPLLNGPHSVSTTKNITISRKLFLH